MHLKKKENLFLVYNDKEESVIGKFCIFLNDIIVGKQFERSHMESTWEKLFVFQKSDWARIYRNNICKIVDKNVDPECS